MMVSYYKGKMGKLLQSWKMRNPYKPAIQYHAEANNTALGTYIFPRKVDPMYYLTTIQKGWKREK